MNQTKTKKSDLEKIILINSTEDESRVAVVVNGLIQELSVQQSSRLNLKGNIYKGKIIQIQDSLQAAFVEYGGGRHGFLALDEINFDIFPQLDNGKKNIRSRIKPGMEVMVQVIREPTDTKGAALSTFIHLPGVYLVFIPNSTDGGVSKRIEDDAERERLKSFISGINSENNTVIIRTAGVGMDLNELKKDYQRIKRDWEKMNEKFYDMPKPGLIRSEANNTTKTIRDYFNDNISSIWIDNPQTFQEVHSFFKQEMPGNLNRLKLFLGDKTIFSEFGIEEQIEQLSEKKVPLPSGGSIVIDQTEALVAIDVNSGRSKQDNNTDSTAVRTNLEAAEEITRQLRLRNLAGLIVIDFIDMRKDEDNKRVEDLMEEKMRDDKASHKIGNISQFGLMEISRQRLSQGFATTMEDKCPRCNGTGRIINIVSAANNILRQLRNEASKRDSEHLSVTVPFEIGSYLLNEKRGELYQLEREFELTVSVIGSHDMYEFEKTNIKSLSKKVTKQLKIENEKIRTGSKVSQVETSDGSIDESSDAPTEEKIKVSEEIKKSPRSSQGSSSKRSTTKSSPAPSAKKETEEGIHPGCLYNDVIEMPKAEREALAAKLRGRILGQVEDETKLFLPSEFLFPPNPDHVYNFESLKFVKKDAPTEFLDEMPIEHIAEDIQIVESDSQAEAAEKVEETTKSSRSRNSRSKSSSNNKQTTEVDIDSETNSSSEAKEETEQAKSPSSHSIKSKSTSDDNSAQFESTAKATASDKVTVEKPATKSSHSIKPSPRFSAPVNKIETKSSVAYEDTNSGESTAQVKKSKENPVVESKKTDTKPNHSIKPSPRRSAPVNQTNTKNSTVTDTKSASGGSSAKKTSTTAKSTAVKPKEEKATSTSASKSKSTATASRTKASASSPSNQGKSRSSASKTSETAKKASPAKSSSSTSKKTTTGSAKSSTAKSKSKTSK